MWPWPNGNADITVTVSKEGYESQVIPLTKEVSGTGAALDHQADPVIVTLQPTVTPRTAKPRLPRRPPSPQS